MPPIRTLYPWALGILVVAAAVAGVVLWVRADSRPGVEVLLSTPAPSPELKVYVSGEVARPGIYVLDEGDRLLAAIEAAGGATQDADLSAVNLALRVADEDHFDIPHIDDVTDGASSLGLSSGPGKVSINTASAEELQGLPGIGDVKARAIVAYRDGNGPFQTPEEILQVSGIGPSTLEGIRDLISVR